MTEPEEQDSLREEKGRRERAKVKRSDHEGKMEISRLLAHYSSLIIQF